MTVTICRTCNGTGKSHEDLATFNTPCPDCKGWGDHDDGRKR